jgi:predicted enzyme related to lactoylglutathione lyase
MTQKLVKVCRIEILREATHMITAIHAVIYSKEADEVRAFFNDTLKFSSVDAGHGWLIFALPPAELGVHPTDSSEQDGRHQLFLMCDNIESTVHELQAKGVEITQPVTDAGWGKLTALRLPGGKEMSLYEPRHASPLQQGSEPTRPRSPAGPAAK